MRKALVDPVPRLVVAKLDHPRLGLVFWRRLDDRHPAVLPLAQLDRDHPPAVGRDEAFVGEVENISRPGRECLFSAVGTLRHEIAVAKDHLGARGAGGGLRGPGPATLARPARSARHDIGLERIDPERRSAQIGGCGRQERAVAALDAPQMAGEGVLIARATGGE